MPGQRWTPTATRRREPKEEHWLNGLTMSSMARSLRCDIYRIDQKHTWNVQQMYKQNGSMGLPWVPGQDCSGAPSAMSERERVRDRERQRESQRERILTEQKLIPGMYKNAIWGLQNTMNTQVKSQLDGPGLLLDFHGQTHAGDRTELGYGISSETPALNLS